MGNLRALDGHFAKGSDAEACLSDANAAVDSAASLTRQLLAFSRKQVISPRPINLTLLVERLSKILERLVGDRIQLDLVCARDLWSVNADPGQLEQVLVNLVMNARDAISGSGKIEIQLRNVELSDSKPGQRPPEALT